MSPIGRRPYEEKGPARLPAEVGYDTMIIRRLLTMKTTWIYILRRTATSAALLLALAAGGAASARDTGKPAQEAEKPAPVSVGQAPSEVVDLSLADSIPLSTAPPAGIVTGIKCDPDGNIYHIPINLPPSLAWNTAAPSPVVKLSVSSKSAVEYPIPPLDGYRGVARQDFDVSADGKLYMLLGARSVSDGKAPPAFFVARHGDDGRMDSYFKLDGAPGEVFFANRFAMFRGGDVLVEGTVGTDALHYHHFAAIFDKFGRFVTYLKLTGSRQAAPATPESRSREGGDHAAPGAQPEAANGDRGQNAPESPKADPAASAARGPDHAAPEAQPVAAQGESGQSAAESPKADAAASAASGPEERHQAAPAAAGPGSEEDETIAAVKLLNSSYVVGAADGNVYLILGAAEPRVYVISPAGEVVREFSLRVPAPGFAPSNMGPAGSGRIFITFTPPTGSSSGPSALVALAELETGEVTAVYRLPAQDSAFRIPACVTSGNNFLFLGETADRQHQQILRYAPR